MRERERVAASVTRGSAFLAGVVVFLPLVLFDYLRAVLSTAGTVGA